MSSLIPYHHGQFSSKYPRSPFDLRGSFGKKLMQNLTTQMVMTMQNFYRQNAWDQQYLRRTRRKKFNLWKKKLDTMPLPLYMATPLTTANPYISPLAGFQVEQEIRYIPYPIQILTNEDPFSLSQNLLAPALPGIATTRGNALAQLPPKIRIIFVPSQPKLPCLPPIIPQPVSTGPLTMPPFLFNRVSSFMNCFALPPPLPQINSLPLTPAVQQMVMQRYNHPSAVLSSMPSLPGFPPFNQSPMPISALQAYPPTSTSYPNLSIGQIPAIAPPPDQQQPCPCRACPPAPPALSIPVKDYSWVQHCSACGGVTKPPAEPNIRPAGGRATPLLTHSARSSRLTPISSFDVDRYPHVNPLAKDRPWLHKLPPLPPGAIIISDEIISPQINIVVPQISRTHERSEYRQRTIRRSKAQIFSSPRPNPPIEVQLPKPVESEGHSSPCSTCSADNEIVEDEPVVPESSTKKHNFARQQLSTSAKKLNLRYNFLPQDIASVYRKNSYAKSTSGDSLSSSGSIRSMKKRSLLIKEYNRQHPPPAPYHLNSIVEESLRSSSSCSFQSKKKSLIIREYSMKSPSITSQMSSDSELFIVVKQSTDSVAMVSLLKAEKNNIVLQETISLKDLQLSEIS